MRKKTKRDMKLLTEFFKESNMVFLDYYESKEHYYERNSRNVPIEIKEGEALVSISDPSRNLDDETVFSETQFDEAFNYLQQHID